MDIPLGKTTMSSDFRGVPLPAASKVGWEWGAPDNRKQIQIPKPHMGFYRTMPSTSLCLLSAPNSQRTFTHCDPPPRPCMTWDDSQVQTMVGSMRKRRESLDPRHEMIRPCVWEDLYHYFHAVDLWRMGAWNLWRVVHRLVDEVEGVISSPPLSQKELKEIEEWVWRWCTHEKNRERLGRWNEMADVISVLSPRDIKNVRWCEWQVLEVLRGELKYWFPLYKTPDAEPEPESKGKQVAKGMLSTLCGLLLLLFTSPTILSSSCPSSFPLFPRYHSLPAHHLLIIFSSSCPSSHLNLHLILFVGVSISHLTCPLRTYTLSCPFSCRAAIADGRRRHPPGAVPDRPFGGQTAPPVKLAAFGPPQRRSGDRWVCVHRKPSDRHRQWDDDGSPQAEGADGRPA